MQREEVFRLISESAQSMQPALVKTRRDFHRYPESGWLEMRTASLVARRLSDLGYEVLTGDEAMDRDTRMNVPDAQSLALHYEQAKREGADPEWIERMKDGMTAVIGILRCGPGPVTALRFDMDALLIEESDEADRLPVQEGFLSTHPGTMHACGHDGHTTIGLGVAQVLMQIRSQLRGTVKLLFQPAEEGVSGGAKAIVKKGHLDDVRYMIGSHITTRDGHESGVLYPGMHGALATAKWRVRMRGQSAHAGAYPEKGRDALLACCCAVLNLNAIARHGGGSTRVAAGRFYDHSATNAISDDVVFDFEVRGQTTELNSYMAQKALRVVQAAAEMYACTCSLEQLGEAESFVSSGPMMDRIRRVCTRDLGLPVTASDSMQGQGSEDVSYFINKTQQNGGEASFMRVMTDVQGLAHGRTYDFDEQVLSDAVRVFAGVVYDIAVDPDAMMQT